MIDSSQAQQQQPRTRTRTTDRTAKPAHSIQRGRGALHRCHKHRASSTRSRPGRARFADNGPGAVIARPRPCSFGRVSGLFQSPLFSRSAVTVFTPYAVCGRLRSSTGYLYSKEMGLPSVGTRGQRGKKWLSEAQATPSSDLDALRSTLHLNVR